jgi:hypothetical protein
LARPQSVVLYKRRSRDSSYLTTASFKGFGDLEVFSSDVGPAVGAFTGGASEYEYWYTIPKDEKDTVLLYLLRDRFADRDFDLVDWLKAHDIRYEFSNWFTYD